MPRKPILFALLALILALAAFCVLREAGIIPQERPRRDGIGGVLDDINYGFQDWSNDLGQRLGDVGAGIGNWWGDLGMRFNILGESLAAPFRGVFGGVQIVLDVIGNLHIMLPAVLIFLGAFFLDGPKTKATIFFGLAAWILSGFIFGIVNGVVIGTIVLLIGELVTRGKLDNAAERVKSEINRIKSLFHPNAQESSPKDAETWEN